MRMWMLPPQLLCRRHLLGEHNELHMLAGSLRRGRRLDGFLAQGLLEPSALRARHDALAAEMMARGYRHASPLPPFEAELGRYTEKDRAALMAAVVDSSLARRDLAARCPQCAMGLKRLPSDAQGEREE